MSSTDGSSTTSLLLVLSSVVCSLSTSSGEMVVVMLGNFVLVDGFIVELEIIGTISQRLPLKPDGHSHLNKPSSVESDVHFPSFKQVFEFSSQYFNSKNEFSLH